MTRSHPLPLHLRLQLARRRLDFYDADFGGRSLDRRHPARHDIAGHRRAHDGSSAAPRAAIASARPLRRSHSRSDTVDLLRGGHFGLALSHYAHFTSPIRRYADLLLHRALKHLAQRRTFKQVLQGRKAAEFAYSGGDIERHSAHCSMTERRADDATRDAVLWLKCEYMSDRVGEAFDGVVSGVAPFGLFVELGGLYVDGLVHVSGLSNDYYQFDARNHRLVGDRTGRSFHLGDPVRVKVVRVNLDERKIDLELIDSRKSSSAIHAAKPESRPARKSQRRRR